MKMSVGSGNEGASKMAGTETVTLAAVFHGLGLEGLLPFWGIGAGLFPGIFRFRLCNPLLVSFDPFRNCFRAERFGCVCVELRRWRGEPKKNQPDLNHFVSSRAELR